MSVLYQALFKEQMWVLSSLETAQSTLWVCVNYSMKKKKTSLFRAVKETKRQCGTNHEHNGMTINPDTSGQISGQHGTATELLLMDLKGKRY